jgi:hypothetical protein
MVIRQSSRSCVTYANHDEQCANPSPVVPESSGPAYNSHQPLVERANKETQIDYSLLIHIPNMSFFVLIS